MVPKKEPNNGAILDQSSLGQTEEQMLHGQLRSRSHFNGIWLVQCVSSGALVLGPVEILHISFQMTSLSVQNPGTGVNIVAEDL